MFSTPEEAEKALPIVKAFAAREPIEFRFRNRHRYNDEWDTVRHSEGLNFNMFEYRRAPREWWLIEDGSNCPFRCPTEQLAISHAQGRPITHVREVLPPEEGQQTS